jgi:hypothetical protein
VTRAQGLCWRISDVHPATLGKGGWILNERWFAWVLSNPQRLVPRPTIGELGLFDLPDDIVIPA